jgi:glyoxylase I family protein
MLGFRVEVDIPEGDKSESVKALGFGQGNFRAAIMQIGDDPRSTRLDLLKWKSPRDEEKPYAQLNHLGAARIALFTKDLDKMTEELKAKGVKFISEAVVLRTSAGSARFNCFYDPDGTVLELIEFP